MPELFQRLHIDGCKGRRAAKAGSGPFSGDRALARRKGLDAVVVALNAIWAVAGRKDGAQRRPVRPATLPAGEVQGSGGKAPRCKNLNSFDFTQFVNDDIFECIQASINCLKCSIELIAIFRNYYYLRHLIICPYAVQNARYRNNNGHFLGPYDLKIFEEYWCFNFSKNKFLIRVSICIRNINIEKRFRNTRNLRGYYRGAIYCISASLFGINSHLCFDRELGSSVNTKYSENCSDQPENTREEGLIVANDYGKIGIWCACYYNDRVGNQTRETSSKYYRSDEKNWAYFHAHLDLYLPTVGVIIARGLR